MCNGYAICQISKHATGKRSMCCWCWSCCCTRCKHLHNILCQRRPRLRVNRWLSKYGLRLEGWITRLKFELGETAPSRSSSVNRRFMPNGGSLLLRTLFDEDWAGANISKMSPIKRPDRWRSQLKCVCKNEPKLTLIWLCIVSWNSDQEED